MPKLSLCMIAKNEESYLRRCLESVQGLVDEIVLVDTGSTDGTIEIARSFGARVVPFEWQDDFSMARNVSLDHATGDWILVLDADESISQRDHDLIRAQVARDDLDVVTVHQRHYLNSTVIGWQAGDGGYDEGAPYQGYLDTPIRRLFRRGSWLRFRNRVHEVLLSVNERDPRNHTGEWVIHHYGKAGDKQLLAAKADLYARIGEKKIQDQPLDPYNHYELGIAYAEKGEPAEALKCFAQALALSPDFRDTALHVAICHARLGEHDKALAELEKAARLLPEHAAAVALEQGNVHRDAGHSFAAERAFRRALSINPSFAAASVNLALLLQRQGQYASALDCVTAALALAPSRRDLQALRAQVRRAEARALTREGRVDDALRALTDLPDNDADAESLRGAIALGKGHFDAAVNHLVGSLAIAPTGEAALNLSSALAAQGHHLAGLAAVAESLRLAPNVPAAWTQLSRLTGAALTRPHVPIDGRSLTFFFYVPRSIVFDARTPRAQGLGGTESAIVYLSEALARAGHRVVVLNNCPEPGAFEGVEHAPWETLPGRALAERPDVLVAVRQWETIGRVRLAPLQIFWTGDAFDQPFLAGLSDPAGRANIDVFMGLSGWQIDTFRAHHGVPAERIVHIGYGTAPAFDGAAGRAPAAAVRPRRLAYTSTPFRGLDVLLALFPRIRARCRDAELDIYSSMKVYGVDAREDAKQFGPLYEKAQQPGVHLVGTLPQPELAARLSQTRILAYPNHYAETFCIAAAEAQAAGCAIVTTGLGALPEVVGDAGLLIPGDPRTAAYQRTFVNECVDLLTNDARWLAMSNRAVIRAASAFSWPAIAGQWEELCQRLLSADADRKSA